MEYIDNDDYIFNTHSDDRILQIIHFILLFITLFFYYKITVKLYSKKDNVSYFIILLYVLFSIIFYLTYLSVSNYLAIYIRKNLIYNI
jgi:hypothetical protein